MTLRKINFIIALVCLPLMHLVAQPAAKTGGDQNGVINKAKLDSFFDILSAHDKAMGTVAISKNGKLLYTRSTGSISIDGKDKMPATPDARYRIGSISKTFTATLIFQLVQQGKLALNTRLSRYFPSVPNAEKITIANLLDHSSGIHNFTDDDSYLNWNTKPHSKQQMVELIAKAAPVFEPGSKHDYSNANYVLLGYIVEAVTGKAYATVLKEQITDKIKLTNTYVGGKADLKRNEAYSYRFMQVWVPSTETDMSIPAGAGAIVSTSTDLVLFMDALMSHKLLSKQWLDTMTSIKDGYGMGIFQFPFNEKKAFGHTGGIDGFSSMVSHFPNEQVTVAYCSNGQVMSVNDIMIGVLSIYFNTPYPLPSFKTIALDVTELEKFTGVYATDQFPLKITVSVKGEQLYAQATGQADFPLDAIGSTRFKFDAAGIEMSFDPKNRTMALKQGGRTVIFTKE